MSDAVLVAALSALARSMAPGHIEALARAVESAPCHGPEVARAAETAVPKADYQANARTLVDAWAAEPARSGAAVALALRAAAAAGDTAALEQQIEIVWTGPTTLAVPVRRTDIALAEVIGSARKRLVVVSFAAYRVPAVVSALEAACDAGVHVTLVLESADSGVLTHDSADAFTPLRHRIEVLVWPPQRRNRGGEGTASLHAKCAVADDHTALVTSANLTGAALTHNMELGLLVRGGPVPRSLAGMWQQLAAEGVLVPA